MQHGDIARNCRFHQYKYLRGFTSIKHCKWKVIRYDAVRESLYRDLANTNEIKICMWTHAHTRSKNLASQPESLREDILSLRHLTNFQYPKNYVSGGKLYYIQTSKQLTKTQSFPHYFRPFKKHNVIGVFIGRQSLNLTTTSDFIGFRFA